MSGGAAVDAKLKTGLLAVGIVAVVGFVLGGATVAIRLVPVVMATAKSKATASATEVDTIGKIATHRFWKMPLTTDQAAALVDRLHGLHGDLAAYIDETGRVVVLGDQPGDNIVFLRSTIPVGLWGEAKPDEITGRYFVYHTFRDRVSPDEGRVAQRLLRILDEMAYRP